MKFVAERCKFLTTVEPFQEYIVGKWNQRILISLSQEDVIGGYFWEGFLLGFLSELIFYVDWNDRLSL
jgi:hypothetical protein